MICFIAPNSHTENLGICKSRSILFVFVLGKEAYKKGSNSSSTHKHTKMLNITQTIHTLNTENRF